METTYLVRGADGKEYGPVNLELLSGWIRERRLIPQQQVKRTDSEQWATAASFPELAALFETQPPGANAPAPATISAASTPEANANAMAQVRSAGSWFYWIAGLSLVNTISAASGSSWRFIVGLGITDLIQQAVANQTVAVALSVVVAGVFVLLGFFANKANLWAFIVGMVLFGLDGLLFLPGGRWLGVAFHVLVLFFLVRGVKACLDLSRRSQ